MFSQSIAVPAAPARSATDRLNAISISAFQLQRALEVLSGLPAHLRGSPDAQALALQVYADDENSDENASAALHARVTALAKWTTAHDPRRRSDAQAVMEAAARFSLSEGEAGICFEPGGFEELVLFIEDLPW
jgi:hypothetical protein